MATTSTSTVTALYLAFYGRPADPAGLKYWADQLTQANGNVDAIKAVFANSEEAQVRFGNDTAAERVQQIYEQLFDREPDAAGLDYWVDVISKGHASVADVAITILNGARDSDQSLSNLRQQAADAFTTQVEASGSAYDGVAAVEAARVLVRAVKPNASKSDVDALVSSTVTLTSVASTSPDAMKAIGSGDQMLALLDTTEGKDDPVAVVETLAETARGASADAHLLASLVQGGGMANLLKALPAGMTIKDLKATMGKGGLPAALKALNLEAGDKPGKPDHPGSDDDGTGTGAATLEFHLGDTPNKLVVKGSAAVTALGNAAGITLEDLASGTAKATTVNYLDGATVESGALVFKTALDAGLYKMSWAADSFTTATGQLAAGSALFAGGQDGMIVQEGFAIARSTTVTGDLTRASTELVNEAFIGGTAKASITIGGGQDLVADNGGTLAIVYDHFDGASDLILGFDSGDDTLVFKGEAATALDANGDGKLQWATSNAVEATAEAVSVTVGAKIVMGNGAPLQNTLDVLNAAVDVSKVAVNSELLILAKDSGDAAALFLYVNKDNNGHIDAAELTQVATFAHGAPAQADIVLIGTAAAPAA